MVAKFSLVGEMVLGIFVGRSRESRACCRPVEFEREIEGDAEGRAGGALGISKELDSHPFRVGDFW